MLRPASPKDLDAILALLASSRLPTDGVADHLASFVVAERHGELCGTGGLEVYGQVALLRSLVVAAAAQTRGIGSRICDRLETAARELGVAELFLLTETAEAFFTRRGYARIARNEAPAAIESTREFSALCPKSATLLRRRLTR